jgi:hypothetical protein
MASVTEARGYMIQSCMKYIEDHYGADDKKRFHESLPKALREKLPLVSKVEWYPKEDVAALFRGLVTLHKDDDDKAYAALMGVGTTIGEGATNTYMRLLMRFMTLRLFAEKVPAFWARDHRGGTFVIESLDTEKRVMVARHGGIGGYDYVAGTAPGFIKVGLSALGGKNVRSDISGFTLANPGPEEVTYTISWD